MSHDPPAGPGPDSLSGPQTGNGHRPSDPLTPGPLDAAPVAPAAPEGPPVGPPGGSVFTLEGRPAPGLYFAAWALTLFGLVLVFVGAQAASSVGPLIVVAGLGLVGLGLSAGAGYQVLARRGRPSDRYRGPSPMLLFGIAFVLSNLAGLGLVVALSVLVGAAEGRALLGGERPLGLALGLLVAQLGYVAVIALFVRRTGALTWHEMGWPLDGRRAPRFLRDAGLAMLVMLPATIGVMLLGGILALVLDVRAPSVLPSPQSSGDVVWLLLAAAVLAPIGEEIFFRGFALTAWHRDLGPRSALIRSSLLFAVVHVANVQATNFSEGVRQALLQFLVILPLGFILGWLFQRRGIIASIAGHATYNGIILVLLLIALRAGPIG